METSLTQSQKASIKEVWHQKPELSASDIAKSLNLNKTLTLRFMQTIGYSTAKHKKAVQKHNEKMAAQLAKEQGVKNIILPVANRSHHAQDHKAPATIEHEKIKAMRMQVHRLAEQMLQAAESGNAADYLKLRAEYAATTRRLEAYQKRGTYNEEDRSIYHAETSYRAI